MNRTGSNCNYFHILKWLNQNMWWQQISDANIYFVHITIQWNDENLNVNQTLEIKCNHDGNFVTTGGTQGCHNNNHQCHNWWEIWHHNQYQFLYTITENCSPSKLQIHFICYTFGYSYHQVIFNRIMGCSVTQISCVSGISILNCSMNNIYSLGNVHHAFNHRELDTTSSMI